VLDAAAAQAAVRQAAERLGGLDILVTIVGQAGWAPAAKVTLEPGLSQSRRQPGREPG
jgi:NAD(P)-dependent dehydrogenase (short-subunit alcohol dehydrogenase family)